MSVATPRRIGLATPRCEVEPPEVTARLEGDCVAAGRPGRALDGCLRASRVARARARRRRRARALSCPRGLTRTRFDRPSAPTRGRCSDRRSRPRARVRLRRLVRRRCCSSPPTVRSQASCRPSGDQVGSASELLGSDVSRRSCPIRTCRRRRAPRPPSREETKASRWPLGETARSVSPGRSQGSSSRAPVVGSWATATSPETPTMNSPARTSPGHRARSRRPARAPGRATSAQRSGSGRRQRERSARIVDLLRRARSRSEARPRASARRRAARP